MADVPLETVIAFVEAASARRVGILARKNHDYAHATDAFANFTFTAQVAGVPVETVFLTLIGVKIARLRELVGAGKSPQNESVADTLDDLINYTDLYAAYAALATAKEGPPWWAAQQ